ncbi:phage tail tape measure protein [Staphylococcus sp. 2S1]
MSAGMPIDKVDRLGASVVALGNTTATTEKEIVEMGQRLAGAGSQAGFSADQIMSISATMSSVGIEAESGGTSMTQIFNKMTKATAEGGDALESFAKTSGMSGEEFAETWENNPTKALSAFVKGLSNTEGGAKGVLKALDNVGIKGIREADTIRRLSNNHKILDKALKTGSKGWKENNALTNEAKTRYKTMGSQLQIFKNQLFALGKDIGNVIAPAVVGITKKFGQWAESFTKMPKPIKGIAIALGLVAAATGPVLLGTGLLLRAIGSAAKGYAVLNRQMAVNSAEAVVNASANKAAAGTLATTGKATKAQQGLFGKLGNVLTVTTGKYSKLGNAVKIGGKLLGKVTIPLTILTTIFGVAYEKMDWFKQGFKDMGKFVNQIGANIDFSWIGKLGKEWDKFKDDMAKGLQDGALFKGIKKGFDGLHYAVSKATDTNNVFGKSVSKGTKKALSAYNNLSEKAKVKLETIQVTHEKIGDKQFQQITTLYGNINEEITKQLNKRHDSEVKGLEKIFKDTSGLSKSEEAKILENTKLNNEKESKETQRISDEILSIYDIAHKEKRSLTTKENEKLVKLQEELDRNTVKSLSKGEVEQKAILERMKQNKGELSMQAAANVIKESAKERDTTVKDAKSKYKDTVAEAIKQRDETGTLSKDQADKVIKDAKDQYDESKGKAEKQHQNVVDQAQLQNKGVKKHIDDQTGHVKSKWEIMKDDSIGGARKIAKKVGGWFLDTKKSADKFWGKIGSKIGGSAKSGYNGAKKWFSQLPGKTAGWFKSTKKSTDKFWDKIGGKIGSSAKSGYNGAKKWFSQLPGKTTSWFKSTKKTTDGFWNKIGSKIGSSALNGYKGAKKWFGETTKNAKNNFKDSWGSAKDKFGKIADKVETKSHSVAKSAGKWFGETYKSTKGNFSNMWGKAKDIFGKIAGEGEDKSKKTHGSWKSWLGKTLDWIKNISKDFGKAASDLGKNVANKAVDGLNGMIGGINKISKAITDKNLIKEIPHLSTGTYDGSNVATDSNGGLRQSTLAVVNDKGAGNAPGGGVQEVIEKADGSLHAPQGRNVVVPLDPGDKVHNARDTKRYKDMGLLPRFASGTKKKKKNQLDYLKEAAGGVVKETGKNISDGYHSKKEASKDALDTIKKGGSKVLDKGKDATGWLGDKIGDVWDYVKEPGKLVEKMIGHISFGKENKTMEMVGLAFSSLKKSLVDKVKSWFEEAEGGDGDATWLLKHQILQTFGHYTGGLMFNGGRHYGMDFAMPTGTSIKALTAGKIIQSSAVAGGGGNQITLEEPGGKWFQWYMHMSKLIAKKGDKVSPGDVIGLSGNTGNSTTPHLHIQRMKGYPSNDTAVDPKKWLESLKGGGQSKAASKWAPEIKKAANRMNVSLKGNDLKNIISLINAESSGNAGVTQSTGVNDINAQTGNLAQGLLQYVPQTFKSYAMKGHGNIKSGYDQLLAFFNNKYWRSQFNPNGGRSPNGPRRYANGGMVTKHQIAEIGEGNKAEMVIPLTKRNRAVQLIEQAMQYVGMDTGKTNVTVNNDNSTIEKLLKQLVRVNDQNNKLTQTIISLLSNQKQGNPKDVANVISQILGENMRMASYSQGG